jgi:hypothetical protein
VQKREDVAVAVTMHTKLLDDIIYQARHQDARVRAYLYATIASLFTTCTEGGHLMHLLQKAVHIELLEVFDF